jgi:uncharacterized membrane protein YdbT with pleckstrin-like domain
MAVGRRAKSLGGASALSYVDKTLSPGEQVLYRARFPWIYTLGSVLALLLLGWAVIGIFIFFDRQIRKWTTEIVVTNHRLVVKTGWIARKSQEVSLEKVEEIKLAQSFWGRVLGYGSLDIRGTGVGNIQLPNIDDPLALRIAINGARSTQLDENHNALR